MASTCNYCMERKEQYLDHFLSTGLVANMVLKMAVMIMRVYNADLGLWKVDVYRWLRGEKSSNLKGTLMGLILVIIT